MSDIIKTLGDAVKLYDEVGADGSLGAEMCRAAIAEIVRLREALEPSGSTKFCYMGEFSFSVSAFDDEGEEFTQKYDVPWDTIKEIMKAIKHRVEMGASK